MSLFGEDQRINYSPYLKPVISTGINVWCIADAGKSRIRKPSVFSCPSPATTSLQVREGRTRFDAQFNSRHRLLSCRHKTEKGPHAAAGLLINFAFLCGSAIALNRCGKPTLLT